MEPDQGWVLAEAEAGKGLDQQVVPREQVGTHSVHHSSEAELTEGGCRYLALLQAVYFVVAIEVGRMSPEGCEATRGLPFG